MYSRKGLFKQPRRFQARGGSSFQPSRRPRPPPRSFLSRSYRNPFRLNPNIFRRFRPLAFPTRLPFSRRNPNIPNTYASRVSGQNITRGLNIRRGDPRRDVQKLQKREKWFDVISGVNKYVFQPGKSGVPHLDNLASIHEQYLILHFTIEYLPSSGTNQSGNITMGVDYAPNNTRAKQDIPLLEPNASGTIFQRHSMTIVVNRAMKGNTWLNTTAAGVSDTRDKAFALYIDAPAELTDIGQIWVSYNMSFATATSASGSALAIPVPVSTISTQLVSDLNISTPTVQIISNDPDSSISVKDSMELSDWDENGSEYQNSFEYPETILPVGSEFTVGTFMDTPVDFAAYRSQIRRSPEITFQYADGSPIEPGTIVPLSSKSPLIQLSQANEIYSSDIFATIFSVLKPVLRTVLATVNEIVAPLIESGSPASASFSELSIREEEITEEPQDLLSIPPEDYTAFTFLGDKATITIPQNDVQPISHKQPLTLMIYGGIGWKSGGEAGFIKYYDYQYYNLLKDFYKIDVSGSGASTSFILTLGISDSSRNFLQNGDLVTMSFNSFAMDKGLGTTVKTPFISAIPSATLDDIIAELTTSTLSATPGVFDPNAPRLVTIQVVNNSKDDHGKDNVGLFISARFHSLNNNTNYPFAVFKIPVHAFISTVPNDVLNTDGSQATPGYVNTVTVANLQILPTAAVPQIAPVIKKTSLKRL